MRVSGHWRSNNNTAIVEACRRGMGIAYMPCFAYVGALQDGGLEQTLRPYWASGFTTWIVYPSRKYLATRARRAVDYLLDQFRDWQEPY